MHNPPHVLATALSACRRSFLFVGVFSFALNLLLFAVPLHMLQLYDRVLASRSLPTLIYLTLMALGALATLGLLEAARSRVLVAASSWLEETLAPAAFDRALGSVL